MGLFDAIPMEKEYLRSPSATARELSHLPGNFGLPVLGIIPALFRDFYRTINDSYEKYGPVSKTNIGFRPGALVLGPNAFKTVFMDSDKNFSNQMGYGDLSTNWFGGGILFRDFDEHRLHRRVFQAAFKNDAMRGYVGMMNAVMDNHIRQWEGQTKFQAVSNIQTLLMGVGANVFYGIEQIGSGEARRLGDAFKHMIVDGLQSLVKVNIPPFKWYYGQKGKEYITSYIGSLIHQRRQENGTDFMSYLVKEKTGDGVYLTDQELIEHLMFLFFAAYDTTTTALSHLLMHLALDQRWQNHLREECYGIGRGEIDFDKLGAMTNVENGIQESLRLYPSAAILMRRSIKECQIEGMRIPENTVLFMPPMFNHRMQEWWENPHEFDPDRFSAARLEHKKHPFIYTPFGGGAHKCIGMNFALMNGKLFMHKLLTQYRFRAPDGYVAKSQTLPLPQPVDGLPLILEKIH